MDLRALLIQACNGITEDMCRRVINITVRVEEVASRNGVHMGRAIAEAVSRWLPTAAARVQSQVLSSGICCGQSGAGAGFLRVLRFPLPIFIPPTSPLSHNHPG
jgi:hypothetical protein